MKKSNSNNLNPKNNITRGSVFFAELVDVGGSVQNGMRPVVIIQNNVGNKFSPTTIVLPLTSKNKKDMPTNVKIGKELGLKYDSTVLAGQVICINKTQLGRFVTRLSDNTMRQVDNALAASIGLS